MDIRPKKRLFKKFNTITIIAVYLLILVGGIVRSTGSGMGCPDWPKCFGSYVPPTNESQLPEDYREIYAAKRVAKNTRLSKVLYAIGLDGLGDEVVNGEGIEEEHAFNATKTWIEYLNRILGVLVGFLILLSTIISASYIRTNTRVFVFSVGALLLVIFQGWIGSLVVSTNLLPGMISFHMALAIAQIALLIYIRFFTYKDEIRGLVTYKPHKVRRLLRVCMILFFAQVIMGSQVREAIDMVAMDLGEDARWSWIGALGLIFYVHRSYSIILLFLHVYLIYRLTKSIENFSTSKYLVWSLLLLVILEILSGIVLSYFALPYYMQPVHLLLAVMIFGVQYFLFLLITDKSNDIIGVNG
ncbi:MAG: COX15/CtaA family protein [Reichenbachiella sp.]